MSTDTQKQQPTLESLRRDIDALDDQIVALLHTRIGYVAQVGKLKRAAGNVPNCFIRSGREANMHRDVYARFKDTHFNAEAAVALWRHIITASTHHESPLHMAAPESLRDEALTYFGNYIPFTKWRDTIPTNATILLAPYPNHAESEIFWQQLVASHAPWRVFSYAPLITDTAEPRALLLSQITAEASEGDDISYFIGGTPPENATQLRCGIWSVPGYITEHEGAKFIGAHATPIFREGTE